ncbi:MAG: phosphoenolpyruvate carboxylase, partial [Halobacteriales archaeon]|nr:phosphoenolpyruvate carboxylase [Halobacteriales archaeon]
MSLHNRSVRRDVRELGTLLGDVLEEQSSGTAFEAVESLRTGSIDVRRDEAPDREPLKREIRDLTPDLETVVARAFTSYFELINLAEERERVREIRLASQSGDLGDSLEEVAETLAATDEETAERVLADVLVEPTFTAHPTEARRKTIKAKLREVGEHLERLDECTATPKEDRQVWRDLEAAVTSLWQTLQVRRRRPSPEDEARN